MQTNSEIRAVDGKVRTLLRAEGLVVLAAAVSVYFITGGAWWLFAVLLFAPDLSFLGYTAGNKVGAVVYNAAHTYIVPLLLGVAGLALGNDMVLHIALIYFAHIGLDRALGYGLKYASGFKHTHLGELAGGRKV